MLSLTSQKSQHVKFKEKSNILNLYKKKCIHSVRQALNVFLLIIKVGILVNSFVYYNFSMLGHIGTLVLLSMAKFITFSSMQCMWFVNNFHNNFSVVNECKLLKEIFLLKKNFN